MSDYIYLRNIILSSYIPRDKMPPFVRNSKNIEDFLLFIKMECEKYNKRRKLIRDAFQDLNEFLSSN